MKFIGLKKANVNTRRIYNEFAEELNKFRLKYCQEDDYDFALTYYSTDELAIIINNPRDYCEDIHKDLCKTFDVRLQSVEKSTTQTYDGVMDKIEFIYAPVHHYIKYLEWEDINL